MVINEHGFKPKTLSESFSAFFLEAGSHSVPAITTSKLTMIKNTVSNGSNVLIKENNSSRLGQKPRESAKLPTTEG